MPAEKVTSEIAAIRGIEPGKSCFSPPSHSAFSDTDTLLDYAELLAETSGLPVGIKSAVGQMEFWEQLALKMSTDSRGLDFVTIDGGEGGTGGGAGSAEHFEFAIQTGLQAAPHACVATGHAGKCG